MPREPRKENCIIFSFMHWNISWTHLSCVGGEECFSFRRISRLVKGVVKATTCCTGSSGLEGIPKRAVTGVGPTWDFKALLRVLNTLVQNSNSLGQDQNMCTGSAGERAHSCLDVFVSFTLVRYALCRSLHCNACNRPCLAHMEEEWTRPSMCAHCASDIVSPRSCFQVGLRVTIGSWRVGFSF